MCTIVINVERPVRNLELNTVLQRRENKLSSSVLRNAFMNFAMKKSRQNVPFAAD